MERNTVEGCGATLRFGYTGRVSERESLGKDSFDDALYE